ncbi:MAG: hypothetical protein SF187_01970 [Deltaproteobacteria bacterium]|nr:hypothetical protein [Deltaproteobacteria bacterium]
MTTHPRSSLVAFFAIIAIAACGNDDGQDTDSPSGPALQESSAETRSVLALTTSYRDWPTFAENPTLKPSPTHNNMHVISYYNDVVGQAMASKTLPLPDGALIVKENWAAPTDAGPMALTIMHKQGADWYWCQVTPDGKVFLDDKGAPLEGKSVTMCTTCHQTNINDGLRTHDLSK